MITETKLQFLDELTDKERSIFLYCFVLKVPKKETARHLKMPFNLVTKFCSDIIIHIEVNKIQAMITELHAMV